MPATLKNSSNVNESFQKSQSNGKSTKKNLDSNSALVTESSAGGEDSIGSVTSDDLSPKRSHRSSSRSLSPSKNNKRIKPDGNVKVSLFNWLSHNYNIKIN